MLLMKESCNLSEWEAQLATPNQKDYSQVLTFFDE